MGTLKVIPDLQPQEIAQHQETPYTEVIAVLYCNIG